MPANVQKLPRGPAHSFEVQPSEVGQFNPALSFSLASFIDAKGGFPQTQLEPEQAARMKESIYLSQGARSATKGGTGGNYIDSRKESTLS